MSDNESSRSERHKKRMQRQKEVVDSGVAGATEERGVVIVNTGNGKGKSSAALGVIARALGHGMHVGVVQFIKGQTDTGEDIFFSRFPEVSFHVMGEGFTWETQNRDRDIEKVETAWAKAKEFLCDESFQLVVLDELNIALKMGYLDTERVVEALKQRPHMQHVIITGRGAPQALIDYADTVTEMKPIKHAYQAGVAAQKGVEW